MLEALEGSFLVATALARLAAFVLEQRNENAHEDGHQICTQQHDKVSTSEVTKTDIARLPKADTTHTHEQVERVLEHVLVAHAGLLDDHLCVEDHVAAEHEESAILGATITTQLVS